MKYDDVTTNSHMADGCHIENDFLPISRRFIARLTRNSVRRSTIMFKYKSRDQNTKFRKYKMADGRHLKKCFFFVLSSRESSDFNEIWCADANFVPITRMSQNIKILQIQYGVDRHIENRFWGYMSTIYCLIILRNLARRSKSTLDTGHVTKMPNFENPK